LNFLSSSNDRTDVIFVFDGPRCNGPEHDNQIEETDPSDEKIVRTHGCEVTGDEILPDYEPIATKLFDALKE